MVIQFVSKSWILQLKLLRTCVYKSLYEYMLSFLLGKYNV